MKLQVKRKTHHNIAPDNLKSTYAKVGFPASKTERSAIDKAIWNEFGTKGGASGGGWGGPIPERPFFRTAINGGSGKYLTYLRSQVSGIIFGKVQVNAVMGRLSEMATGDIRKSISGWTSPPLSPVTIERKQSSKPLVHTGQMISAVTYEVIIGNLK